MQTLQLITRMTIVGVLACCLAQNVSGVGADHEYLSTHPSNVMATLPTLQSWCEQQAIIISRRVRKDPSIVVAKRGLELRLRPFRHTSPEASVLTYQQTGVVFISVSTRSFVLYVTAQDGKLIKTSLTTASANST
jgi:hypothetical protein